MVVLLNLVFIGDSLIKAHAEMVNPLQIKLMLQYKLYAGINRIAPNLIWLSLDIHKLLLQHRLIWLFTSSSSYVEQHILFLNLTQQWMISIGVSQDNKEHNKVLKLIAFHSSYMVSNNSNIIHNNSNLDFTMRISHRFIKLIYSLIHNLIHNKSL